MNAQGQCVKCHQLNDYTKTICDFCGSRLPWASAIEDSKRQQVAAAKAAEDAARAAEEAKLAAEKQIEKEKQKARMARAKAAYQKEVDKPAMSNPFSAGLGLGCGAALGWSCLGPLVLLFIGWLFLVGTIRGCTQSIQQPTSSNPSNTSSMPRFSQSQR